MIMKLYVCIDRDDLVQMVSTERVLTYTRLKPEASLETKPNSHKPPPDWPNKGRIELSGLTYKHSPQDPLVLRNINVTILPSEKVCNAHY